MHVAPGVESMEMRGHQQAEGRGQHVPRQIARRYDRCRAVGREKALGPPITRARPGVQRAVDDHAGREACADRRRCLPDGGAAVHAPVLDLSVIPHVRESERVGERRLGARVPRVAHEPVDVAKFEAGVRDRGDDRFKRQAQLAATRACREFGLPNPENACCHGRSRSAAGVSADDPVRKPPGLRPSGPTWPLSHQAWRSPARDPRRCAVS